MTKVDNGVALSTALVRGARFGVAGLFSGIGGFELGMAAAGHVPLMLVEIDAHAQLVLREHFPRVPLLDDVTRLRGLPAADVVVAGFPCQDLSQVGRAAGIEGTNSRIVDEVFKLVRARLERPRWLVFENVPFMLHLQHGRAMRRLISQLEALGYCWAYRVVDTRAFGLPQRRFRVYLVASADGDPRDVLLTDDAEPAEEPESSVAYGFYWTEGSRGVGWAVEAIPPLKGGSGVGISSPPAIWRTDLGTIVMPDIRDAERLQGFPEGWTSAVAPSGKRGTGLRWKLVGNAVSVPIAAWIGRRLAQPAKYDASADTELNQAGRLPKSAWGMRGSWFSSSVSSWPVRFPYQPLSEFTEYPGTPLSLRASKGFLDRARSSTLRFETGFLDALETQVQTLKANGAATSQNGHVEHEPYATGIG